jgi:hypothetical protein
VQGGCNIVLEAHDPFTLILKIGTTFQKAVSLPLPLNTDSSSTKIARRSLYITYTAPVATLEALALRPDTICPTRFDNT